MHCLAVVKVLLVDDDAAFLAALESAVLALGHEVRAQSSAAAALREHERDPADVILCDWDMPDMSGVELCRRVREHERNGPYTYFILVTGYGDREHYLRGMGAGADDYQSKPVDLDELHAKLQSAARVIALDRRLTHRNERLRRHSERAFRLARTDALTTVGNRLRMEEDLAALFGRARRYGHKYSVALCDLDRFKEYNDRFGHVAGDDVLRRVATALSDTLRQGDSIYRYGGEEFLVVLPEQSLAV